MKTVIKLFLVSHHIPVKVGNDDALFFYRTVARLHGFSLVRCGKGWVMS